MQIIKKQFNNQEISFDLSGQGMINATEMAKANGKRIPHFFENKESKEYIETLSSVVGIPITELVVTKQGGNNQGTWVHRKLAIRIAQWCSPKFAVQVDSWIEELFLKGKVELRPKTIEEMTLLVMQDLQSKVLQQQKQIEEQKPLVAYAEAMSGADNGVDLGDFAKAYSTNTGNNIGRNNLFELLRDKGVFMAGKNIPKQQFVKGGYFIVKQFLVESINELRFKTLITPTGEKWLVEKLNKHFLK